MKQTNKLCNSIAIKELTSPTSQHKLLLTKWFAWHIYHPLQSTLLHSGYSTMKTLRMTIYAVYIPCGSVVKKLLVGGQWWVVSACGDDARAVAAADVMICRCCCCCCPWRIQPNEQRLDGHLLGLHNFHEYASLTTRETAWCIISVVSVCLPVCMSVFRKPWHTSSYLRIRYISREYGSSMYMKVIWPRSRSRS